MTIKYFLRDRSRQSTEIFQTNLKKYISVISFSNLYRFIHTRTYYVHKCYKMFSFSIKYTMANKYFESNPKRIPPPIISLDPSQNLYYLYGICKNVNFISSINLSDVTNCAWKHTLLSRILIYIFTRETVYSVY